VLRRYVTASGKLHADDTPVPVLAPGNGKTKTGRLWTYVRDDRPAGDMAAPAVWFAYSPDRKGEHPERHLREFRGTLQADAYAGFNRLYETGRIQGGGMLVARSRKFYDLQEAHASPVASEALERIAALYAIEKEIRGRPAEERQQIPQRRAFDHCSSLCDSGSRRRCRSFRANPIRQPAIRYASHFGMRCCVIRTTGTSRSTTMRRTGPTCGRSRSKELFCLPVLMLEEERAACHLQLDRFGQT